MGAQVLAIDATRRKLFEAGFFLRKLADIRWQVAFPEPEAFECYLSAFLSAARSVTWVLQAEQKQGYDTWYPVWKDALSVDERDLLSHFNEQRVQAVHRAGAEVNRGTESLTMHEFLSAASRQGMHIEIWNGPIGNEQPTFSRPIATFKVNGTDAEVVEVCSQYLALLTRLVEEFTHHYENERAT
jgi:hypothetical protein